MKPVVHPPDAILRAYGDLINQVFLFLRASSHHIDHAELFDLADAMHNVATIVMDYGAWTDDKKYREYYLRPFDAKWGKTSIQLEQYLESRLQEHLKP
ncbi:MAG TPA: hypothetical protein VKE98_14430 [Gemmataceae bacterium]|nr:hypothetical protein [Gemmataceae bacterium]